MLTSRSSAALLVITAFLCCRLIRHTCRAASALHLLCAGSSPSIEGFLSGVLGLGACLSISSSSSRLSWEGGNGDGQTKAQITSTTLEHQEVLLANVNVLQLEPFVREVSRAGGNPQKLRSHNSEDSHWVTLRRSGQEWLPSCKLQTAIIGCNIPSGGRPARQVPAG